MLTIKQIREKGWKGALKWIIILNVIGDKRKPVGYDRLEETTQTWRPNAVLDLELDHRTEREAVKKNPI